MSVAVLTAIYDGYDTLKPFPAQDAECETICVTDDSNLTGEGWQRIVVEPREGVHPNLAAKRPKIRPWLYTDAELTIWIDGSFIVQSSSFVRELSEYDFAQFTHPRRDCVYDEFEASRYGKYAGLGLDEQRDRYRSLGHPEHWGLWANGVIVRRDTPAMRAFCEAWQAEIDQWGFQDQLSEAPMLRLHGLRPESLPGSYLLAQNPWLAYAGSGRH